MKHNKRPILLLALVTFVLVASVLFVLGDSPAAAQSGGGYDLTWHKVAGGGATISTGGDYELGGTIGQPEAGAHSGGDYSLNGGFWQGVADVADALLRVFLPVIIK